MKLPRAERIRPRIPIVALADVVFLLVGFFMLTTSRGVESNPADLPESRQRTEARGDPAWVVLVQDARTGKLTYHFGDGRGPSASVGGAQEVGVAVARLTREDPARQFILKADGGVQFEKIDELLDQLRANGARDVLLLTRQRRDPAEPGR